MSMESRHLNIMTQCNHFCWDGHWKNRVACLSREPVGLSFRLVSMAELKVPTSEFLPSFFRVPRERVYLNEG